MHKAPNPRNEPKSCFLDSWPTPKHQKQTKKTPGQLKNASTPGQLDLYPPWMATEKTGVNKMKQQKKTKKTLSLLTKLYL